MLGQGCLRALLWRTIDFRVNPVLLFLGVFVSLVFFLLGFSLIFLSLSCLFYRIFKGPRGEENPWCF